ncbi:MAG: uncharacterized protein PWP24_1075 [Clostridiales bacterium]|nr:uncharacterized protein [Clostridiales bacterium]
MSKNGYFQLIHKENGTFIRMVPAENGGLPFTYDMLARYLSTKKIVNYNVKQVAAEIASLSEEKEVFLVAERILPENEYLEIFLDDNKTKANGIFYPPSSSGKTMSRQEIMNELVRMGIKCGVKEDNIDAFLTNRNYCMEIVLAEAIYPVQGKSAVITYHFKTKGLGKPKILEDGTVDFHQLEMINKVNAGDVLATLVPVDYGKPGLDIFGNIIRPAKVVAKILRHGGNIHLSEDKLTMYSDVCGHVSLVDDRVFVSDTYEVASDVSVSSGDIDYDGNVVVKGNVVTGFTVKAKGDIIVEGVVEGATLVAEGQIIIKRGIQGMGKAKLIAKRGLTARFIENCEVVAEGDITTDAIMHSRVSTKGNINVTGRKSMITGGEIKAGRLITAKTIGSSMCAQTSIVLGVDESVIKEQKDLLNEMETIRVQQQKYMQVFAVFKKKMQCENGLTLEQKRQLVVAKQEFTKLQEQLQEKENRNNLIKAEIASSQGGRIKFTDTVYPGVKVTISGISMYVKDEVNHGQFILDHAEIKIMSI